MLGNELGNTLDTLTKDIVGDFKSLKEWGARVDGLE